MLGGGVVGGASGARPSVHGFTGFHRYSPDLTPPGRQGGVVPGCMLWALPPRPRVQLAAGLSQRAGRLLWALAIPWSGARWRRFGRAIPGAGATRGTL